LNQEIEAVMRLKLSLLAATLLLALPALAQDNPAPAGRGRGAPAGPPPPPVAMPAAPYHVEDNWAALPGRKWGAASGIDIDKDGKSVWVFERCSGLRDDECVQHPQIAPIMKFDEHGKLLKAFGAGMFKYPHGVFIDRDDHIWVADGVSKNHVVGDTIRIFDQDGKLLATHGTEGVRGSATDPYNYNEVSDVLQAPNGDIFVADGHDPDGNDRVLKYDRNWKFIKMWGQKGSAPEDFNPPHGLAMDKEGRLYVADRGNRAVKRFDQNGKLLDVWKQFGQPSGVFVDKNDILYVADSTSRLAVTGFSPGIRMAKVSDGKIFGNIPWPEQGTLEGVAVADDGTIYGGFTNIPGAHRWVKN
jgi:sugar lactone lactonase YvrE